MSPSMEKVTLIGSNQRFKDENFSVGPRPLDRRIRFCFYRFDIG